MTKARGGVWRRFLLLWAALLLALGALGCFALYRYLDVYERTRPELVMDALLADLGTEGLLRAAEARVPSAPTAYEDAQSLFAGYLSALDLSRALNYCSDGKNSDADRLAYLVRSGPNEICRVYLRPEGASPGFSRRFWAVDEICAPALDELLPSVTLLVDAMPGDTLLLNGRPLTDDCISDPALPLPALSAYEAALDEPPCAVRYRVGPLFGELTLTDEAGLTLSTEEAAPGTLHSRHIAEPRSYSIRAPEDLRVEVNGLALTAADAAARIPGVLAGLEAYLPEGAALDALYRLDGLYAEPDVRVFEADGSALAPIGVSGDTLVFLHAGTAEAEALLRPVAESFFTAYVDYSAKSFSSGRYRTLLRMILPDSRLYRYVAESKDAMYWASATAADYRDLRYENFRLIGDALAVCTVSYRADLTAQSWNERYRYELSNAYALALVRQGDRWLVAGMDAITGQ